MAPSAGSNACQAKGLGRRFGLAALAALVLTALVVMTASVASGAEVTEYVRSFGPDGTEGTDFGGIRSVALDEQSGDVYVLDQVAGTLYKFGADGTPVDWGGSASNLSGHELTGLTSLTFESQVAVDSSSHVVYVGDGSSVKAFQADGDPAEFTAGPGMGTNEIAGLGSVQGVAVDANGSIYANNGAPMGTVRVYASSGELLTSFQIADEPTNLAVAPDGRLFAIVYAFANNRVEEFTPSEFPVTSSTTYTLGKTFKEGEFQTPVSVDVDSSTGDLYVLDGYDGKWVTKYDSSGALIGHFGRSEGPGGSPLGVFGTNAKGLAVVPDGEAIQFYVGDNRFDSSKVDIIGEVINPGPPSVLSTSARDVTSTSATLRGEVNPNTFATTFHFEYGLDDCAVSACTSVPLADAPIGSGHRPVAVSQEIEGLQPGTSYHYRVVAANSEGVTEGPDRILTTQVSGLGFDLADRRAWEMVSPPNKRGALLIGIDQGQIQAAEDGNGLAYLSVNSIDEYPDGSRVFEPASVLARRGSDGWRSEDIATAHDQVVPVAVGHQAEYKLFSFDLSKGLVEPRGPTLLSPQASERTPYLRENTEPGIYVPLVSGKEGFANVPPGTEFGGDPEDTHGPVKLQGASSNLENVVLSSTVSLGAGPGLYRWSGGQLHPVSELPAGEGGGMVGGRLGSNLGSVRNAVSEDGSRVFWATGEYGTATVSFTALYLRDTEAEESVRLDVMQSGASGAGEPRPAFHGASADGTVVYFTDSRQLTEDASPAGRDLYRCEIPAGAGTGGCATLTNVSAPLPGSGESAMVKEMSPALSEDGSRIYFVAEGVLDTAANEEGDAPLAGEPNLYLYEEGEGVRFIATLADDDGPTWGKLTTTPLGYAHYISADASPSGRYFAFMSQRSLTGYENRDAVNGEATEQAYRYDATSERLDCVSCNPTGAAPRGRLVKPEARAALVDPYGVWNNRWMAAALPQGTTSGLVAPSHYRPRVVLENGRVLFNAADALVPADSNSQWDVYQYEPVGVGDCTASSGGASTSISAGGCVSLLSSGTAEEEAAFLDSSASGDDVFFMTSARLSVLDEDSERDIYDARVDGVPATLPPDTECLGEACQPAAVARNYPTPASAGFKGKGNLQQSARKRCAKGKRLVRRKGKARCVARGHKRQGKASTKRRASR